MDISTTITPVALVSGIGMILVGLGFIGYAMTRRLNWRYLLFGILAWLVTSVLHALWTSLVDPALYTALRGGLPKEAANALYELYFGVVVALFSAGLVYLLLRFTRLGKADWKSALAFGIGFGAIETLLMSYGSLHGAVIGMTSPDAIPPEMLVELAQMNNFFVSFAPVWEHFFITWAHILTFLLVFLAVVQRRPVWFWLAFLFKGSLYVFIHFTQSSSMILVSSLSPIINQWLIEGVIMLWGAVGWYGMGRLKALYPQAEPAKETVS